MYQENLIAPFMSKPFEIDQDRKSRLGFEEVVYGAAKSVQLLEELLSEYSEQGQNVLVTKLQVEKAQLLQEIYPDSFYDPAGEIFMLKTLPQEKGIAEIGIISAGSSDMAAAYEAFYTLQYMGYPSALVQDIGVAGLHRLLDKIDLLRTYKILIVIAGFEGALPTVMGGLLPQPIIGVPTSTGYGTAKQGETALHAMLTSCANGITVVNIDNGYGAAMSAIRILQTFSK